MRASSAAALCSQSRAPSPPKSSRASSSDSPRRAALLRAAAGGAEREQAAAAVERDRRLAVVGDGLFEAHRLLSRVPSRGGDEAAATGCRAERRAAVRRSALPVYQREAVLRFVEPAETHERLDEVGDEARQARLAQLRAHARRRRAARAPRRPRRLPLERELEQPERRGRKLLRGAARRASGSFERLPASPVRASSSSPA